MVQEGALDIALEQASMHSATPRPPGFRDRLIFFLVVPTALALLFSLVGIRLIAGMDFFSGLFYMLCHMYISWWSVSLGTWSCKALLARWRPQPLTLCLAGFLLALAPSSFLFMELADWFSARYPGFAANRAEIAPATSLVEYALRWVRYSIPALILFTASVFVYRRLAAVDWLAYPGSLSPRQVEHPIDGTRENTGHSPIPTAGQLEGSKLPAAAEIIAAKAEQHYVQLYSSDGNELLRYRFGDIVEGYQHCEGGQVHRSWWVNYRYVRHVERNGRNMELILADELTVPVSQMYKAEVSRALAEKMGSE